MEFRNKWAVMEVILVLLALDLLVKPLLLHLLAPVACPWSMVFWDWGVAGAFALLVLVVCALYGRSLALWPRGSSTPWRGAPVRNRRPARDAPGFYLRRGRELV